ncbi:MAG: lipopolysaccharide heptosyltransferase II [Elusimicrobiota bacterium]|jgi:heptosyltransferase-2|nr:lipopolysaccharide heptosyltransferase II [Elusimicrobiota bacterium]
MGNDNNIFQNQNYMNQINKILVIQTAFLGDIVLTMPLINNIKSLFPNKKLVVLTTPTGKEILAGQINIDEIIVYDKNGKDKGFFKFLEFVNILKFLHFDLAIVPHRSIRSALLTFIAKIPYRIGFRNSQGNIFFNFMINYKKNIPEIERNLYFLEKFINNFDIQKIDTKITFPYHNELQKKNNDLLDIKNGNSQKIIGIHVGAKWNTKKWIPEKFIELIRQLDKKNCKIVVFGESREDYIVNNYLVMKNDSRNILNLIGKTNLQDLIAIFRNLSLYVSNDSGPMHIAAAIGVPVIAIFGPTVPSFGFAPYNKKSKVIEAKNVSCRPCGKHGNKFCPRLHFNCMNKIEVEHVFDAIKEIF